jgi:4'-phosphopantetheinyl transferase EntD
MPLLIHTELEPGIQLGIWEISESIEELVSQLYLNQQEFETLEEFRTEHRKKQWLSYRVLIRNLVRIDTIYKIYYTSTGKPYLVHPPRNISITHSGNFSATLISENIKINPGIDIEKIDKKVMRVRSKYLNPVEQIRASVNPSPETYTMFWSAKETVYKCYDNPQISLKDHIHIHSLRQYHGYWLIKIRVILPHQTKDFLVRCERFNDYILSYTYD